MPPPPKKHPWPEKPLGEVCAISNGRTPKTGTPEFWGGSHQWITPAEMGNLPTPYASTTQRTLTDEGLGKLARLMPPRSVIMSCRAPIGHLVINETPMAFNQGCKGIVPSEKLHYKYLYHFLQSSVPELEALGKGTTFKELSASSLKSFPIPLPPLPEQKRLVALLDKAHAAIAQAQAHLEKNIANSQELFQSVLQNTFQKKGKEWRETKLEKLCSIRHGFAFKSQFFASKGELVVLTPGNFFEGGGYRDRNEKTKYYHGEFPKEFLLSKGDFLVAMTEQAVGLLGSTIIVPESGKFLHNQRLGFIQPFNKSLWDNSFFFHQFNTPKFRNSVQKSASGVKVRHTSPKKLGNIKVLVPPLKEQKSIVKTLDTLSAETRALETRYRAQLAALEELKQSLLQKAFAGEI